MKILLVMLPLLVSLSWGATLVAELPGAHSHAAVSHHAPSPAPPVDVIERGGGSSFPCGMTHCANMVGCSVTGAAVGARTASLLIWTVAGPGRTPLILEFQTATRTAIPPPPRA
jgi:hypothetical protein